jgi:hypothetical protein
MAIKTVIQLLKMKRTQKNHNHQIAAIPTVRSAISIPMKLLSLAENGLTLVFPAALLDPAELEGPVAEAVEVILLLGVPEGEPEETLASPRGGRAALGSISQPVGVGVGQAGNVNPDAEAAYAEDETPVGWSVAHWAWRFEKSGETGVGVPWRVNLAIRC